MQTSQFRSLGPSSRTASLRWEVLSNIVKDSVGLEISPRSYGKRRGSNKQRLLTGAARHCSRFSLDCHDFPTRRREFHCSNLEPSYHSRFSGFSKPQWGPKRCVMESRDGVRPCFLYFVTTAIRLREWDRAVAHPFRVVDRFVESDCSNSRTGPTGVESSRNVAEVNRLQAKRRPHRRCDRCRDWPAVPGPHHSNPSHAPAPFPTSRCAAIAQAILRPQSEAASFPGQFARRTPGIPAASRRPPWQTGSREAKPHLVPHTGDTPRRDPRRPFPVAKHPSRHRKPTKTAAFACRRSRESWTREKSRG